MMKHCPCCRIEGPCECLGPERCYECNRCVEHCQCESFIVCECIRRGDIEDTSFCPAHGEWM